MLANKAFRWFLGANISKEYIWLLLAGMLPFWRKYALGIQGNVNVFGINLGGGDAEAVLLGVPILLAIPTLLIWRPIVARLGYRKTWIIGTLTFIPGLLVMTFANNFYTGLLGTMLTIPGLANSMIMPFPVISEIIDEDAKQEHGFRREGLFFGMNSGIIKLAFSAQGLLFALVTAVTGFAEGSDVQTASAIWGIRFLIGVTPAIAALIIAWCMSHYPLGRETITSLTLVQSQLSFAAFASTHEKETPCISHNKVFQKKKFSTRYKLSNPATWIGKQERSGATSTIRGRIRPRSRVKRIYPSSPRTDSTHPCSRPCSSWKPTLSARRINLLRGDANAVGHLTTGGTESIMLAVKTARDKARAEHPEITQPEMVLPRRLMPPSTKPRIT